MRKRVALCSILLAVIVGTHAAKAADEDMGPAGTMNGREGVSGIDRRSWAERMNAAISRHKRYPPALKESMRAAGRPPPPGRVVLDFSIDRDGRLVSLAVKEGSGLAELDEAAMDMIRHAAPLPAPPPEVKGETVRLVLPVHFRGGE